MESEEALESIIERNVDWTSIYGPNSDVSFDELPEEDVAEHARADVQDFAVLDAAARSDAAHYLRKNFQTKAYREEFAHLDADGAKFITQNFTREQGRIAPRHDLDKNQAQMHVMAAERVAENVEALKKNPALATQSPEALEKLAYYRGILQEDLKRGTPEARQGALAKFDRAAEEPGFLKRLERSGEEAAKERGRDVQEQRQERKDTPEQSL